MRRALGSILACAWLATGCAGERAAGDGEAALADSSAAGYTVGPRSPIVDGSRGGDSARAPARDTQSVSQVAARPAAARVTTPAARSPETLAVAKGVTPPSGKPVPSAGTARLARADTTHAAARMRTPPRMDTAPVLRPAGPVTVNEFLVYDAATRSVSLQLIGGYNGLNGALNFNGGARGSHGVTVPRGWTVRVLFTNRDTDLRHSAIAIRQILPPPVEMPAPVFAGAMVARLEEGLHSADTAAFGFVTEKVGQFMIACGVPGHAQGGMWIRFTVSPTAAVPAYR